MILLKVFIIAKSGLLLKCQVRVLAVAAAEDRLLLLQVSTVILRLHL